MARGMAGQDKHGQDGRVRPRAGQWLEANGQRQIKDHTAPGHRQLLELLSQPASLLNRPPPSRHPYTSRSDSLHRTY